MHVQDVLEQGIADGTHIGAQLYVSHRHEMVADLAIGEARDGVPMTTDSLMLWFSMTKAVTAVAVAQQWERGALDIDERVAHYIPEFAANAKDAVTVRHLLTHTAGIPLADGIPYSEYVRGAIFEPLGMRDCWVGMPDERYHDYGDRIGFMHNTEGAHAKPIGFTDTARTVAITMPGGGGRGPMREVARMYEALLYGGVLERVTVAAISARHRTEMLDETFGVVLDWGLGLAVDTFAMGRHCSRQTFGHGGHQSSVSFCDPVHEVVVAVVCNGMPGLQRHNARLDAIASAVYVDLGLAEPGDPGRAKPFPTRGL